jgi:hypothetical protein
MPERSYQVAFKGGDSFGRKMKEQSLGVVRVETDDTEAFGYLIGEDLGEVRVASFTRFVKDNFGFSHGEWQVLRFPKRLIKRMTQLSERGAA